MYILRILTVAAPCLAVLLPPSHSTSGIEALVARRLASHVNDFSFEIANATESSYNTTDKPQDNFEVSNAENGTIHIVGNTGIALTVGLRWYLTTYCNVDLYWFLESRLDTVPHSLPQVERTYHGSSIVPWRYHFNTVTFSYTSAFWTWEDWELQLDWMALRGVNLPLAWVGYEKILVDVFLDAGFTEAEINSFLSGPAFQAWNRFGNIQGSWGGDLPSSWIEGQFELNKKIVARMIELGMTPVLPCSTGFVPQAISRVAPNASFVNGSAWNEFPPENTNVTFLEPNDPLFATLQHSFISKQQEAYGNVSSIYTLDQYNENDPFSGDVDYLRNVTSNTYASLRAADPNAVWMLQGWLFYSSLDFWTEERVEAYLSGVEEDAMIVLDLFSESEPQWQRTKGYYGKPWIWCMLHDYGGNMGLYGQVENITYNPVQALYYENSTMIGMGLTMEGEEGNEIVYDLVLDQAWSEAPFDTQSYFYDWVWSRYSIQVQDLYEAWDIMQGTVYNNTNLTIATAVTKSIFELSPNTTGLIKVGGHHPSTIAYNPTVLVHAWTLLYSASDAHPSLWEDQAYAFDLTDVTRQVMANAFYPLYDSFVSSANSSTTAYNVSIARQVGAELISLLQDLDEILAASNLSHFSLAAWTQSAQRWVSFNETADGYNIGDDQSVDEVASFYAYNAINQVTLWGPEGEINNYASKQWAGLVGQYYAPVWKLFIDYTLNSTTSASGVNQDLKSALVDFGRDFKFSSSEASSSRSLKDVMSQVIPKWPSVFSI